MLQQRDRYITRLEGRLLASRRASAPCRSMLRAAPLLLLLALTCELQSLPVHQDCLRCSLQVQHAFL